MDTAVVDWTRSGNRNNLLGRTLTRKNILEEPPTDRRLVAADIATAAVAHRRLRSPWADRI